MKVKKFKDFVSESVNSQQEINIENFPNVMTDAMKKAFFDKGHKDGSESDDKVKTKLVSIKAKDLKPSQNAIYLGKALGMAIGGVSGGDLGAIISKDNYILDGHHRWAATMFNNPDAMIKGHKADLNIGDLIPVLRALGDALGNERRGEPKGGDVNIFEASIKDALACVEKGSNMSKKFYNRDKSVEWLDKNGGEDSIQEALAFIQSVAPPSDAPPRNMMPVIDADKGEEKKAAKSLNRGDLDVRTPYAG